MKPFLSSFEIRLGVIANYPVCSARRHSDWNSNSKGLFDTSSNAISPYNNTQPWTGLSLYLDWTIQNDDPLNGNNHCDGWTAAGGLGSTWSPGESDFSYVYGYTGLSCTDLSTLICVEQ